MKKLWSTESPVPCPRSQLSSCRTSIFSHPKQRNGEKEHPPEEWSLSLHPQEDHEQTISFKFLHLQSRDKNDSFARCFGKMTEIPALREKGSASWKQEQRDERPRECTEGCGSGQRKTGEAASASIPRLQGPSQPSVLLSKGQGANRRPQQRSRAIKTRSGSKIGAGNTDQHHEEATVMRLGATS